MTTKGEVRAKIFDHGEHKTQDCYFTTKDTKVQEGKKTFNHGGTRGTTEESGSEL